MTPNPAPPIAAALDAGRIIETSAEDDEVCGRVAWVAQTAFGVEVLRIVGGMSCDVAPDVSDLAAVGRSVGKITAASAVTVSRIVVEALAAVSDALDKRGEPVAVAASLFDTIQFGQLQIAAVVGNACSHIAAVQQTARLYNE